MDLLESPKYRGGGSDKRSETKVTPTQAASDPSLSADDLEVTAQRLTLTDFLDLQTVREMQDSFNSMTRLVTTIRDAAGKEIVLPTEDEDRIRRDQLLEHLVTDDDLASGSEDGEIQFSVPIIIEDQVLGSITIDRREDDEQSDGHEAGRGGDDGQGPSTLDPARVSQLAAKLGMSSDQIEPLLESVQKLYEPSHSASMRFLYLMANAIARLCYQEYHLQQSVEELSALYKLSQLLAGQGDLQHVLDTAARSAVEVLKAKASSIRLLAHEPEQELVVKSVYNLSQPYVDKGPILVNANDVNQRLFNGEVVYVEDMSIDDRVIYKEEAKQEGLVSFISVAMKARNRPIGVIRVYSGETRHFSASEIKLLKALADLAATSIENARLSHQEIENQRVKQQLRMGASVQRRMMPAELPKLAQMDVAARYVPSFELGGDFYDFIPLDHDSNNTGIAIGDVVGKGVAASLLMASVRASLRAYAQDIYDLDEIMARVNIALCGDTRDSEFATLFYGVIDPQTLRMTYCNAGHDPPLVLRDGEIIPLDVGGMIVGVDPRQPYDKSVLQLEPKDVVLFYTDGLVDAQNFEGKRFGRDRIVESMREAATMYDDGVASHVLNHVLWKMRNYIGLNRPIDDTTLVVLRVLADGEPSIRVG